MAKNLNRFRKKSIHIEVTYLGNLYRQAKQQPVYNIAHSPTIHIYQYFVLLITKRKTNYHKKENKLEQDSNDKLIFPKSVLLYSYWMKRYNDRQSTGMKRTCLYFYVYGTQLFIFPRLRATASDGMADNKWFTCRLDWMGCFCSLRISVTKNYHLNLNWLCFGFVQLFGILMPRLEYQKSTTTNIVIGNRKVGLIQKKMMSRPWS